MVVRSERIKIRCFWPRPNLGGHFGGAGHPTEQPARNALTSMYLLKLGGKLKVVT